MTIKSPRVRMAAEDRRNAILEAAVRSVEKHGFVDLSMEDVAVAAGCTRPLVIRYLGNIDLFRQTLVKHAVKTGNLKIIGHGLIIRDKTCRRLPEDLKVKALHAIAS